MNRKRILYALIGVLVMLFAGFIYAWSILSFYIAADYPDWSSGALSLTFTLCMAFFCLGGIAAGLLSKRIPVRINVMCSAILFVIGFLWASRTQSLGSLYVSYGIICGTASGMAYNSVLNVIPKWFPNRPGLISGILLMGFGASSLAIGSLFTFFTPEITGAWRSSFLFMGILIGVVLFACSFLFTPPKAEDTVAISTQGLSVGTSLKSAEMSPGQMLRQPSFWLFWVWAALLSGVGLAIVAQARPIATATGIGLGAELISLIVGLISVCNGLGRIIIGGIYDRFGSKTSLYTVNIISVASALTLITALLSQAFPLVVIGFLGVGVAYGGCPTMSAAFTRTYFGQKNYPVNLPVMNLNLLVSSLFGTMAGALYDVSSSHMTTFIVLAVCASLALAILPFIEKPESGAHPRRLS